MPYSIRIFPDAPSASRYCVVNQQTGRKLGCHPSRDEAITQLRAVYANTSDEEMAGKDTSMNGSLERKAYDAALELKDEETGRTEIVVSVFGNVDEDKDVVEKGAFAASIQAAKQRGHFPTGVAYHDWKSPVAKTLDAWEADDGLHVIAEYNLDTQIGRETYSNVKKGLINVYSFGFKTLDAERKEGVRHIKDLRWFEWSPVLVAANPETRTVSVKDGSAVELWRNAEGKIFSLPDGLTYEDETQAVLAAVGGCVKRGREIHDLRVKEGRAISSANRERIRGIYEGLGQMTEIIAALLTDTEPRAEQNLVDQAMARYQQIRARANGVSI